MLFLASRKVVTLTHCDYDKFGKYLLIVMDLYGSENNQYYSNHIIGLIIGMS